MRDPVRHGLSTMHEDYFVTKNTRCNTQQSCLANSSLSECKERALVYELYRRFVRGVARSWLSSRKNNFSRWVAYMSVHRRMCSPSGSCMLFLHKFEFYACWFRISPTGHSAGFLEQDLQIGGECRFGITSDRGTRAMQCVCEFGYVRWRLALLGALQACAGCRGMTGRNHPSRL